MIKYLKQYTDKTFEELVNSLIWFDNPLKLKAIFAKLPVQEANYKIYSALLTQSGTDAPIATILENTLGTVTFSYSSVGNYTVESDGLFTNGKTYFTVAVSTDGSGGNTFGISSESSLYIEGYTTQVGEIVAADNLNETPIEIKIYN